MPEGFWLYVGALGGAILLVAGGIGLAIRLLRRSRRT
jgi:hypothetical protein